MSMQDNDELRERIRRLEALVRDVYESLWTVSETWAYDSYHERMAELGLEVEQTDGLYPPHRPRCTNPDEEDCGRDCDTCEFYQRR